jgi:hypothetical protein
VAVHRDGESHAAGTAAPSSRRAERAVANCTDRQRAEGCSLEPIWLSGEYRETPQIAVVSGPVRAVVFPALRMHERRHHRRGENDGALDARGVPSLLPNHTNYLGNGHVARSRPARGEPKIIEYMGSAGRGTAPSLPLRPIVAAPPAAKAARDATAKNLPVKRIRPCWSAPAFSRESRKPEPVRSSILWGSARYRSLNRRSRARILE